MFDRQKNKFELNIFLYEFKVLLESGLTIIEIVLLLKGRNDAYQHTLTPLSNDLRSGLTLSQSMHRYPDTFPALLIATIKSTEQTGNITTGLTRYIRYTENMSQLKNKIVSASIYPVTVLCIGSIIFVFLMLYLVPKFSLVYADLDVELPFFSLLLISTGTLIAQYKLYVLLGLAAIFALLVYYRKQILQSINTLLLKFQLVSYYYHIIVLTRFYRSLSLMLDGGYPLVLALDACKDTLNSTLRDKVDLVAVGLKQGKEFSHLLNSYQLSTEVADKLLKSGEKNGNLSQMLDQTATFHDLEISRFIESASKIIEPILMIFIGGFIGFIVILLYLPIFDMVGSL